jgi:hypothetical protein
MPIPETYKQIVESLVNLTGQDRLRWTPGATGYEFFVPFEETSIKIADVGEQDDTEFRLSIINSDGQTIDSFSLSMPDLDFYTLQELWRGARAQALGIDKAIGEIQSTLQRLEQES